MRRLALLTLLIPVALIHGDGDAPKLDPQTEEGRLISGARQLTFAGRRSGEGYFAPDGKTIVYQAEREPGNPFYQIYRLTLATGESVRVSPGHGKTTCAWPHGQYVLYASTHLDPSARAKQKAELERRKKGERKRYSWDYDAHYDLFLRDMAPGGKTRRLTKAMGYDAECALSPDGKRVVFSSNRHAFGPDGKVSAELSAEDRKLFALDKASQLDIYVMNVDGSGLRRLTTAKGYDGGPFFSPDGSRICWRRFDPSGAKAEIFTMKTDGTDVRQLTSMGAMSWAPFWHPSGEYLIYATNVHGFANFELYLVRADGEGPPRRVTYTPGFDGLPVFDHAGTRMMWTSTRTSDGKAHLFLADWDHAAARALLGLGEAPPGVEAGLADGRAAIAAGDWRCRGADVWRIVRDLTTAEMAGRLTGTAGERRATAYVAGAFAALGLEPLKGATDYYEPFTFNAGVALGKGNRLAWGLPHGDRPPAELAIDTDWRPLAFSASAEWKRAGVVFAGYGIEAPAGEKQSAYSSYGSADVKGKWVMVLRFMPEDVPPARRQYLARYASLRHKAMIARDKGAVGLVVVSGPKARVKQQLVPLAADASLASTSIAVVSVTDAVAQAMLRKPALAELQTALDQGKTSEPRGLYAALQGTIALTRKTRQGRNVIARLAGSDPSLPPVYLGAHVDHLGTGDHGSRARGAEKGQLHHGADDNASGVAALLEAAAYLKQQTARGLRLKRDVVFAAWSGEELGLIGSTHHADRVLGKPGKTRRAIAAVLNLDMVGRYREALQLQGTGSSPVWPGLIEAANAPVGLRLRLARPAYLPTDSTPFYLRGVPILAGFSGTHDDYHTPRDTLDRLNVDGAATIARLFARLASALANAELPPHVAQAQPQRAGGRARSRVFLGTIPDYAGAGKGLKLSGVVKGGPAEKAGLKAGDLVVEMGGKKIETIYDFAYALRALRVGTPVKVVVLRDSKRLEITVTPASRE